MPELHESIAQYYHERTKYDPETIASKSQGLDWAQQPVPFKEYKIGTTFDLKPYLKEGAVFADDSASIWWRRLSRLLFCSYGLTARMPTMMGSPIYLRAAPSAGGLYPAEVYLISRGTPFLGAGLYSYQPQTHTLIHFWESEVWQALQAACFWHPILDSTQLALVTTAVFYRSAWRYHDRAYRRIFLDTGHLLGNIELASALNDCRAHLIGGFVDEAVADLLYLDREQEGAITVVPLADLLDVKQNLSPDRTALPSATQTNYPHIPDGELLAYCHRATQIQSGTTGKADLSEVAPKQAVEDKYNFPFCLKVPTATSPIDWGPNLEGLESTIGMRQRYFSIQRI